MAWHVRGTALPNGASTELWVSNGRITYERVLGAETIVDGGIIVPGLVDAHTHPGSGAPGSPLRERALRHHALQHRDAGVSLLRILGLPQALPDWFGKDEDLPRALTAGRWLAPRGAFAVDSGHQYDERDLPAAAVAECIEAALWARRAQGRDQREPCDDPSTCGRGGWAKLYVDWVHGEETLDGPTLSLSCLQEVTRQVHAIGGRVAVHALRADSCRVAVEAQVDSIEHGLHLDPQLLAAMAYQGTALVPTFTVWQQHLERVASGPHSRFRQWFLSGLQQLGPLVAAAHTAGVSILAGTDSMPHGRIASEIRHLAAAGLTNEAALGAASWTARSFLDAPQLEEGAPADFVVYSQDPRKDLDTLDHPQRIVLRGNVIA